VVSIANFGAPVRADDRVHRLAEHVKRDAQRDPEKVFARQAVGLLVHPTAERGDEAILEEQVRRRQSQADADRQQDGVPDAPVRLFPVLRAKPDADVGAAAVAHHHGNGQRRHRKREYDRVRGVPVRAEIVRVGNIDLVDNVVERADQQGNDAGDRKAAHQLAEAFLFQERVRVRVVQTVQGRVLRQRQDWHKKTGGVITGLTRFTPLVVLILCQRL